MVIGPDDFECDFFSNPPYVHCYFTWKNTSGSATTSAEVSNPGGGTVGNVYLYGRTALYAYLVAPGKPKQKISVPAGADTITFAPTG